MKNNNNLQRRQPLLLFTLLYSLISVAWADYSHIMDADIYLVRHMEKQRDGTKDPALTEKGWKQANKLKAALHNREIAKIYSTNYQRTLQTAEPLAQALGLEVTLYDPKDLAKFAATIKQSGQKAVVVGHSNTTPELAWHLTGQPQRDIDEDEYNRTFYAIKLRPTPKFSFGPLDNNAELKKAPEAKVQINPKSLHAFESQFDMLFSGNKVGSAQQKVLLRNEHLHFTETTVVDKFKVNTTITAVANSSDLQPVSLTMSGKMGGAADINLKWQDGQPDSKSKQVSGYSDMSRAIYKPQGKMPIDDKTGIDTIERTTAIMSIPFWNKDKAFSFEWFNSYDGLESPIQFLPMGKVRVTVPAGTFNTYKVKLLGGAPSQIFYISDESQPKVVKIEVIHMPWSYELSQYTKL